MCIFYDIVKRRREEKDSIYIQRIMRENFDASPLATGYVTELFKVEIEKLDCVLSKRATRPYIYGHTSVNACVCIYV